MSFGEAFVAVLKHQENRGVSAVLDSLTKDIPLLRYDHENQCFKVNPEIQAISREALDFAINRRLG